jgi:cytochrome c biogenesis protein CcmG, thiol:disulfide interchange protein DsbE
MTAKPANFGLWFVVLGLFVMAGLLALRDCAEFRQEAARSPVGKLAPDAPVTTLSGQSLLLSSFRGRPVWLNFFATWCPPCKAEMPQIEARYRQLHAKHLLVVGVDQQETPQLIARFVKPLSITFPIVIDEGPAAASYSVFNLPTSVFIDSHGIVRALRIGEMSPEEMNADLAQIMK